MLAAVLGRVWGAWLENIPDPAERGWWLGPGRVWDHWGDGFRS